MILYRVQNASGYGPWSERSAYLKWHDDEGRRRHNMLPRAEHDGRIAQMWGAVDWWHRARTGCEADMIGVWFSMYERHALERLGFSVAVLETNGVHIEGHYQAVFDSARADLVDRMSLRDERWRQTKMSLLKDPFRGLISTSRASPTRIMANEWTTMTEVLMSSTRTETGDESSNQEAAVEGDQGSEARDEARSA